MIDRIKDAIQGKVPLSLKRSDHWPTVRKNHLLVQPTCVLCGGTDKLNVHHILPFHLHPDLELNPSNLITLCESLKHGVNCHLLFGYLGNFKNVNPSVVADVGIWAAKLKENNNNPDSQDKTL